MKGWLLDVYQAEDDKMAICFRENGGDFQILKKEYIPEFYVYGSRKRLRDLKSRAEDWDLVIGWGFEEKRVRLRDLEKSTVLSIECGSMDKVLRIARRIENLGGYRDFHIYNLDIPYPQSYLHKHDLFPLARVECESVFDPSFELLDSARSTSFDLPSLSSAYLSVSSRDDDYSTSFGSEIGEICLRAEDKEPIIVEGFSEREKILKLTNAIKKHDPDIIFTKGGDSWTIPYLHKRAKKHNIRDKLILGRTPKPISEKEWNGTSFSSYGQVYYKPSPNYLKGRIHIDTKNSFIYEKCGLQGLIELARITRTPLQRTARSSIGTSMTNLQLYWAHKNDVLIPWRKKEAEDFKNAWKLLKADRGGLIYEPEIGIHKNVAEIDFSSFYPTMMKKYNISPETVLCDCCPDSEQKVPELEYNICKERKGLIPQVLKPILEKREEYKKLMKEVENQQQRQIYDKRQSSLKWVLVTCFGYLGYKNARFGRIEAHEAVTAYARKNLKKATEVVERNGFEAIHGIVDSLWIKKPKFGKNEISKICDQVEKETGLPIGLEDIYRWIAFPSSKESDNIPATNRYYGVLKNGEFKAKGLAMNRRDTPYLIEKAQKEMLDKVTDLDISNPEPGEKAVLSIVKKYVKQIKKKIINPEKLAIKKKLSRNPDSYRNHNRTVEAAKQLSKAGPDLHAGQTVKYIVTDAKADKPKFRVEPIQLLERQEKYDSDWYCEKLIDAAEEILDPFGYNANLIKSKTVEIGEQQKLIES